MIFCYFPSSVNVAPSHVFKFSSHGVALRFIHFHQILYFEGGGGFANSFAKWYCSLHRLSNGVHEDSGIQDRNLSAVNGSIATGNSVFFPGPNNPLLSLSLINEIQYAAKISLYQLPWFNKLVSYGILKLEKPSFFFLRKRGDRFSPKE